MNKKGHGGSCSGCHSLTTAEANRLVKSFGGIVKKVRISPVAGLYELSFEKDRQQIIMYMDFGKKYIIPNPIYSLASGKPITEKVVRQPASDKRVDINKITKSNSIVLGNPKGKKVIFVFTDPECPYCKKLHLELKKIVAQDHSVAIYIKLLPLQMHPQAYDKARVILSRNSLELLDKAFSGAQLPPPSLLDTKKPVDDTTVLRNHWESMLRRHWFCRTEELYPGTGMPPLYRN
jgi:thiol:disulfide interchange protein DsbC